MVASRFGPANPRGVTWKGAGGCVIVSQSRHENRSRTVWMTFQRRGITSRVSVTSSPSFDSLVDPQQGQVCGAAMTTRSRGRCSGNGWREGRWRSNASNRLRRCLLCAASSSSVAAALEIFELQLHLLQEPRLAFRAAAVEFPAQLLDRELEVCDERFRARQIGLGVGSLGPSLRELGLRRDARRALGEDHRMSIGKVGGERFGGSGHRGEGIIPTAFCKPEPHPTEVGRQVAWG